jgi:glycosyltransferase involved in cell wall biosynthesis
MKIAIDALPLLGNTGVRTYLYNLLSHLLALDKSDEYVLCFRTGPRQRDISTAFHDLPNVTERRIKVPNRLLEFFWTKNHIYIPGTEKYFGSPDIFFSTMSFVPVLRIPIVSVFYDITPMKIKAYSGHLSMFQLCMRNIVARSKYIVSISESSKADVCNIFNAEPGKVVTIPLAANTNFRIIGDRDAVRSVLNKYGIDRKYILYVGNLGPHKNVSTLVKAFKRLKSGSGIEHCLVLCGKKHWGREVLDAISRLDLCADIMVLDYVPDEDLPFIYNGADLFVYISLYEGFGLPIVEAMSCGLPVITSNIASMPEVAGGAGILVDPLDEVGVAASIIKVLSDDVIRREQCAKSLLQAGKFSWEATAKKTLDVFTKATG